MRSRLASTRDLVRTPAALAALAVLGGCGRGAALGYLAPPAAGDGQVELGGVHASISAALREEYRGQAEKTPPPVSLVPTDGSELELRALSARVKIEGPLAHTELHFTFRNREPRVREGRFTIALPPDAAIDRFAMKVGETWREARVVTRERGREVYETFLHRGVDPALLEQDLGNQFSARVFPIAPESDKELVVAYDHRVSAERPYRLALEGLPAVPALSIEIEHDGQRRSSGQRGGAPQDVVVPIAGGSGAVVGGDAFVARIEPACAISAAAPVDERQRIAGWGPHGLCPWGGAAPRGIDRMLVLVDTSASRAPVMGRQVEQVRALVAALPPDATVAIAAFDHGVDEVYRGRAGGAGVAVGRLYEHGALGASDLGAALRRAAASGAARVVIVGDGAPTLGEHEPARLAAIVRGSPIARIDAIQIGQSLDADTLAAVVAAGREPGAILDGRDPAHAVRQLAAAPPPEEPIRVEGAEASFPATTRGVAPGEPIWVAGRRAGDGPLVVRIGARTVELEPGRTAPARVRRAAAKAEIAALTEQLQRGGGGGGAGAPSSAELGARIEALALEHRLVSARTSMLVLESDADERRMLTAAERGEAERGEAAPGARTFGAAAGAAAGTQGDGAPIVDQGSTRSGITLTDEYTRNIPVGRTFESVLGVAKGQGGGEAIMISGRSSLENTYIVEGIHTGGGVYVPDLGMSSLGLEIAADRLRSSAAPFGLPSGYVQHEEPPPPVPYTGELAAVMRALARGDRDAALARALRWQLASPGEVAAILALGESLEARGAGVLAARAYGSLIDLFPNRAELLRAAGSGSIGSPPARPPRARSRSTPTAARSASARTTSRPTACSRTRSCGTAAATRRSTCSAPGSPARPGRA